VKATTTIFVGWSKRLTSTRIAFTTQHPNQPTSAHPWTAQPNSYHHFIQHCQDNPQSGPSWTSGNERTVCTQGQRSAVCGFCGTHAVLAVFAESREAAPTSFQGSSPGTHCPGGSASKAENQCKIPQSIHSI